MADKFEHIPTSEMRKDIADTEAEIRELRKRIDLAQTAIANRVEFIQKIKRLIQKRERKSGPEKIEDGVGGAAENVLEPNPDPTI